jgi:hypothetical protein
MLTIDIKNKYSEFLKNNLLHKGWQIVESKENNIVLNKKYSELQEINILIDNCQHNNIHTHSTIFHLSVPLNNSEFSFYKKINGETLFSEYLKQYIDYIN